MSPENFVAKKFLTNENSDKTKMKKGLEKVGRVIQRSEKVPYIWLARNVTFYSHLPKGPGKLSAD